MQTVSTSTGQQQVQTKWKNRKIPVPARDRTQVIAPTTTHFTGWALPVYLITYI